MKSLVKKRAVSIDGRKTSISLEEAFWTALKGIAQERGETVPRLITSIDAKRKTANRSSVLRVFILEHYVAQSTQRHATRARPRVK
jgi:predicted DNA-binding ribbon-helix-helix protein